MAEHTGEARNRLDRRKARTRAALVRAAQSFLAAGNPSVPIAEITQAADVGLGSFYNHFESKEELFRAAVDDALGLFRAQPELSRVLLNSGPAVLGSDTGLVSRARRDIQAAARAGRFTIRDPDLAPGDHGRRPAVPRPAAARSARPRRRPGRRPDRRGPAPHVRRPGRRGSPNLPAAPARPRQPPPPRHRRVTRRPAARPRTLTPARPSARRPPMRGTLPAMRSTQPRRRPWRQPRLRSRMP